MFLGFSTTCMGAHFFIVELDNVIRFSYPFHGVRVPVS